MWNVAASAVVLLGGPSLTGLLTHSRLAIVVVLFAILIVLLAIAAYKLKGVDLDHRRIRFALLPGAAIPISQDAFGIYLRVDNFGPTARFVAHVPKGIEGLRQPLNPAFFGPLKLRWEGVQAEECRILRGTEGELFFCAVDFFQDGVSVPLSE